MEVRIQLLGFPHLLIRGVTADGQMTQSTKRLFYYLALHRNKVHSRESVAGILWGDRTQQQARRTFRSELYRLRKGMSAHDPGAHDLFSATAATIELKTNDSCSIDIEEFETLATSPVAQPVELLSAPEAELLRNAAALYAGPLLMDSYEDWCVFERQRLRLAGRSDLA